MNRLGKITGHLSPPPSRPESKDTQPVHAHGHGHGHGASAQESPGTPPPGVGATILTFQPKKTGDVRHVRYNDVHFHPTNYHNQGVDYATALSMMDKLGIQHTVMAPIPTIQLVRDGKGGYAPAEGKACCGCNYYIPLDRVRNDRYVNAKDYWLIGRESPKLDFDNFCDATNAARYMKLPPEQRKRFDPMITGLQLGTDNCADQLLRKMEAFPGVYSGVGEVTVHKEFVQEKVPASAQASLPPGPDQNIHGLVGLIKTCGDIGMPMVIHCDADVIPELREPGAPPKYFDHMMHLLAMDECRNTQVIWAHAGGAGKYAHLREDHVERLDKMLDWLPHVNIDISWDVVADQICNEPVKDEKGQTQYVFNKDKAARWIALFEKYPDRILFGSDSLAPLSHEAWDSTARQYKALMACLTPATRDKIMKGNYERIIVGSRERVRTWEKHCLKPALAAIQVRNDDPLNKKEFDRVGKASQRQLLFARVAVELELARGDSNHELVQHALDKVRLGVKAAELAQGRSETEASRAAHAAMKDALSQAYEAAGLVPPKEKQVA